jgi:hypothetical protein
LNFQNSDVQSQASDECDRQTHCAKGGSWNEKLLRSPSADALKMKKNLQKKKLFLKKALCQHIDQLAERECD